MLRYLHFLITFFVVLSLSAQGLRSNVALGWSVKKDTTSFRPLNVGVLGNVQRLKGVQLGLLSAFVHKNATGLNLGGLFAGTWGEMRGVQVGGLATATRHSMRGWQASGLANFSGGETKGLQTALAINVAPLQIQGLQLSGLANMAYRLQGVQLAGLTNLTGPSLRGAQIAGFANVATAVERGLQLTAGLNLTEGTMRGLQLGTMNYADTLSGVQVGILNIGVRHPRGAQIGLINIGGDTTAFRLGFVNVDAHTRTQLLGYFGTSTKFHLAARFMNRRTYSILGVGTHYLGLDKNFSGALFYRTGLYRNLSMKWRLLGDVGFSHIETFTENLDEGAERLYALSGRIGMDYQCWRKMGVFFNIGIEHARYYSHNTHYKTRPLLEIGVIAF